VTLLAAGLGLLNNLGYKLHKSHYTKMMMMMHMAERSNGEDRRFSLHNQM
jgi:hypothetical protein